MRQLIFKQFLSKIYSTLFSLNFNSKELEINKKTRCLLLVTQSTDEIAGCGGLMLQNPENFDVYCLTNAFKAVPSSTLSYEEKVALRKKEFCSAMEKANVNYYHFFEDIDAKRLVMRYDRFKTISLSDYDYIFIPNILEQDRDKKSVAIMLKELMNERPYRKNVKIVMYETKNTLPLANVFVDIEETFNKKIELLETYQAQADIDNIKKITEILNRYHGIQKGCEYAESYNVFDLDSFNKICRIYKI